MQLPQPRQLSESFFQAVSLKYFSVVPAPNSSSGSSPMGSLAIRSWMSLIISSAASSAQLSREFESSAMNAEPLSVRASKYRYSESMRHSISPPGLAASMPKAEQKQVSEGRLHASVMISACSRREA